MFWVDLRVFDSSYIGILKYRIRLSYNLTPDIAKSTDVYFEKSLSHPPPHWDLPINIRQVTVGTEIYKVLSLY